MYIFSAAENSSFCASHKQRGYSKFISLSELYEVKNGYFKDDDIILEVEILKMAIIMEPLAYENFTWKLENLSKFDWLKRNHSGPERHWYINHSLSHLINCYISQILKLA